MANNENRAYKTVVNVPQIADPEEAVRLYYTTMELSTQNIQAIFGCSRSLAQKLKKRGREEMSLSGTPGFNSRMVNTKCAYKSWGVDVPQLDRGLNRGIPGLRMTGKEER